MIAPGTELLDTTVVRLLLATALGLFLGLEREWSEKPAGVRTFSLTALSGAVFTVVAQDTELGPWLLVVGGVLVIVQGVLLAAQGLRMGGGEGLSLTTSVSLLVAYGAGVLVAAGDTLAGVTVAVVSSLLLVLKRELHGFAGGLSREELRSTIEFAILAFVVYPTLPAGPVDFAGVSVEPRVAWLMVVTVAGIGIVNYAVVRTYGGRGVAITGFFGGLASSTAVVGTMLDHVRQHPAAASYGVAAVLLADAAMAFRNLVIALAFTLSGGPGPLLGAVWPLALVVLASFAIAYAVADWSADVEMELESPFSMRNVLGFGAVFLVVLVVGALAQGRFGNLGLYVSALLSGLVSSAGAATTAVLLYRGGAVGASAATVAVLLATASSVVVKAALVFSGPREFAVRVARWSALLLALVVASGVVVEFGSVGIAPL